MAGPGMAVIGTAKQGHSAEWQRNAMAMTGKGVAVRGSEWHSNGEAKLSKEPQWRGGATTSSDGSGIDSYVWQGLRLLCVARA